MYENIGNSEFQIPTNNPESISTQIINETRFSYQPKPKSQPETQKLGTIYSELNSIYGIQSDINHVTSDNQNKAEKSIHPISMRLYQIAEDLESARQACLDSGAFIDRVA